MVKHDFHSSIRVNIHCIVDLIPLVYVNNLLHVFNKVLQHFVRYTPVNAFLQIEICELKKKISVRHLSVLRSHSFFSSSPQRPMTSDFKGFLSQILSISIFNYLNS